ncbi:MAG: diaminopimelate epimerase [Actinobacteria bacterium]|nr:diaminopimelate epimerase [Actinomycetota bacterium]
MLVVMRLAKLHGLGNDFLVALDAPDLGPDDARALCDRRRGVGADGLLVLLRGEAAGGADARMVLFNSDGSRAAMSGNGVRCAAHALVRADPPQAWPATRSIDTDAGLRTVVVHAPTGGDGAPRTVQVEVDMGPVTAGPRWAPSAAASAATKDRRVETADIGNPHLVCEVLDPWAVDVAAVGTLLEADFPDGMNVEFIAPTPGRVDELDLTVWERGAGVTEACGTGASAAATVAHRWGIVGPRVVVHMPGGDVEVRVGDRITLVGPSEFIATVDPAANGLQR